MSEIVAGSRVLVTGASGVVGTAVAELLSSEGYDVVAVSSVDGDLREFETVVRLISKVRPTGVIHLAAKVHGLMGNSGAQGEMYFDNALINTHVIEASRLAGVQKVVAMGTVAAYADGVPLPMREQDLWNGRPHQSEAGYAHAKRAMIAQLEAYKDQYGLDFAVALSTNLFGPDDRFDEVRGHVLPSLISKFHRGVKFGEPVTIWGTGIATRDFLFNIDAARALQLMLERGSGLYNLATGTHVTIRRLAELLQEVSGYEGELIWDAAKPDGQPARDYDITRLRELGWYPHVDLRSALAATYEWYAANYEHVRR